MPFTEAVSVVEDMPITEAVAVVEAVPVPEIVPVLQLDDFLERLAVTLFYILWITPNVFAVGALAGLREWLICWHNDRKSQDSRYPASRLVTIASYDTLINFLLGRFLIWVFQKLSTGHTSLLVKILQIITSNIVVREIFMRIKMLKLTHVR
ncbi:hypothetical protein HDV62DRAFT_110588 [Trichoderma sp. SZMC 28011]